MLKKVVITHTFKKVYKQFWGKQTLKIQEFIHEIEKDIRSGIRYLKRPICKIKIDIYSRSIRLAAHYDHDTLILIPIFITDKNTLFGYNLVLSDKKIAKHIYHLYELSLQDIDQGNFEVIEL